MISDDDELFRATGKTKPEVAQSSAQVIHEIYTWLWLILNEFKLGVFLILFDSETQEFIQMNFHLIF